MPLGSVCSMWSDHNGAQAADTAPYRFSAPASGYLRAAAPAMDPRPDPTRTWVASTTNYGCRFRWPTTSPMRSWGTTT